MLRCGQNLIRIRSARGSYKKMQHQSADNIAPGGIMPFSLFVMSVTVVTVLCKSLCQTKAATFIFPFG